MSTQNSTPHTGPPRQTWQQLADEHLGIELLELQDRVRDLEADNARLREALHAAVDGLHTLTAQNDRLRACLRRDLWQIYGRIAEPIAKRRAA